jgi:peptidylprolyl isomerase
VPVSDPIPTGAPVVPVQVGPPPTGLVQEDLIVGTGPAVAPGATVTVDYIGVSCSTGKIFDSSYRRRQPATFALDQVIPGWTQGLVGMQVGGRRLLGIPPDLAYGSVGSTSGGIAPDETLWFVVELKAISP